MPEPLALESGRAVDDLGKGIAGMLIAIGGERRERLDFRDRVEPAPNVDAVPRPPGFDRPRQVRAPLQRRRDRHEDRVVLPVVQLHQAMEPPDRRRGGTPFGLEPAPEVAEARRRERLALEHLEDVGQHVQVARRTIRGMQRAQDRTAHRPAGQNLNEQSRLPAGPHRPR